MKQWYNQFVSFMTACGRGGVPVWLGYVLIAVAGLAFFQNGEFANELVSFAARNQFDYQTSWQSSLFGFLSFIGGPAMGAWLWIKGKDLLPWNKILLAAILVEVGCGVVIALTQNFAILIPVRILQGAVSSIMAGLGTAIVSAVFDRRTARRINSCLQPAVALGVAIGLNVPKLSDTFHLDWSLIIFGTTLLIGLAEWFTMRFIPDIRPLMQEAQQEAAQTQSAPAVFLVILVVYSGLGAAVQQIFVNGLFSYPQATLQSLGTLNAQGVAAMGGNIAFLGAIVGAIIASALSPKLHFPIAGGLAAVAVVGIGYGFLANSEFLIPSYYAFAFAYNLGVGTLAAPLAQDVQNTETRQTAAGVFILVQGLVSAGYAGLYLPLLAGAPAVLFFGSALAIAVMVAVMSVMYHSLTKPQQTAVPATILTPALAPLQAGTPLDQLERLAQEIQHERELLEQAKEQLALASERELQLRSLKVQLEEAKRDLHTTVEQLREVQLERLAQGIQHERELLEQAKEQLGLARKHELQLRNLQTQLEETRGERRSTLDKLEETQKRINEF